ncbi:hypothetical protein YC2023_070309 [Brassica napus]
MNINDVKETEEVCMYREGLKLFKEQLVREFDSLVHFLVNKVKVVTLNLRSAEFLGRICCVLAKLNNPGVHTIYSDDNFRKKTNNIIKTKGQKRLITLLKYNVRQILKQETLKKRITSKS